MKSERKNIARIGRRLSFVMLVVFLVCLFVSNLLWINSFKTKSLQYIGLASEYISSNEMVDFINQSMNECDAEVFESGLKALEMGGYQQSFYYIMTERISWSIIFVSIIFLSIELFIVFFNGKIARQYDKQIIELYKWANLNDNEKTNFSLIDSRIVSGIEELKHRISGLSSLHKEDNERLINYLEDISHQLKTPLAVIRAICEKTSALCEEASELMKKSTEQIDKMADLIRQLLLLGRFECGKIKADFTTISPEVFFETLENDYFFLLEKEHIVLNVECKDNSGWICDEFWIRQTLDNLLTNSIKNEKEGGRIDILFESNATSHQIRIWDDGKGFENGAEKTVFERFSSKDRTGCEGAGLGLPIAKQAVELHFGTIEATNHFPCGAEFCISLPKLDANTLLEKHDTVTLM